MPALRRCKRRDRPAESPTKRLRLQLLRLPTFHWLWSPDSLADYERGVLAIEQDTRGMRRAAFDRTGFQLLLAALQLHPPVPVSATALREVRRQISQTAHARQRDLDDAIYLACALDGAAQVLTSNDATLLGLGSPYADCSACPAPAVAALRRPSPCPGALRWVLPPHARRAPEYPAGGVSAGR
jgi:hypothetical protein